MPSINEIRTSYGEEQAKLLNELFALSMGPLEVDVELSGGAKERLVPAEYNNLMAAESAAFLQNERDRIKARYLELDMELRAAVEIRLQQIERELSPKNASFADFAAAAAATPEALNAAMDMALDSGDEDAALIAFQAGRQRHLDEVTSHAITVNETWGELYAELQDAASDLGLDPEGKFETLAPKVPSREQILSQKQSTVNTLGQMY